MAITIHLRPEIEKSLSTRAKAAGMSLDQYVLSLLEAAADGEKFDWDKAAKAVEGLLEFGDKYQLSFGEPITRKSLHEGHRF